VRQDLEEAGGIEFLKALIQCTCYPHSVRRNRKVLLKVLGEAGLESFNTSWQILHDCTDFGVYSKCFIPLFLARHRRGSQDVKDAMDVLVDEYLVPSHGKMNHSRASVPPGYTNSNQGLEGQFRYVKDTCFDFVRHSTTQCVDLLFDWTRAHSKEQQLTRPFEFEIGTKGNVVGPCYFKAQSLVKNHDLGALVKKKSGCDVWYFPSSELVLDRFTKMNGRASTTINKGDQLAIIKSLTKNKTELVANPANYKNILANAGKQVTLDAASTMFRAVHIVTKLPPLHHQQKAGVIYECDCVGFHGDFVCKHVLALALHKGEIEVPREFCGEWFTDSGGYRGPGRPPGTKRKMPPAFVIDRFDES
jgi:hypothetical protein